MTPICDFESTIEKTVPYAIFHTRELINSKYEWVLKDSREIFDGKRVVVFAVPGAFTPTCSNTHLPGYEKKYDEIISTGIDEIYCLSVNDAFVMNAWFKQLGIKKVKALPDGNSGDYCDYTFSRYDDVRNYGFNGFGRRSARYSMVVDNGSIEKRFDEERATWNTDPFKVSDAETMLEYLKSGNQSETPKGRDNHPDPQLS